MKYARLLAALTVPSLAAGIVAAAARPPHLPPEREPPRLVLLFAVDQMIPEQLERLGPYFDGGLKRILDAGRVFGAAELAYGATETGPGHATLATGCNPWKHGIVSNSWLPQDSDRSEYCVRDASERGVTSRGLDDDPSGRVSAGYLERATLGELLRAIDGESLSVSISSKDRAAVCMAGKDADCVLWWDRRRGGFMSSTAYGDSLPAWVQSWNSAWPALWSEGPFARGWTSSVSAGWREAGTDEDGRAGESGSPSIFPHALPAASALNAREAAAASYATAVGDYFVADLAIAALDGANLGRDEHPDVLALSFSACDTVGHGFGPYSHEVTDVVLRLDRELGRLFSALDERVGEGRWVAALTADHGVLPLPEWLLARGIGARRVPLAAVLASLEAMKRVLVETFGGDFVLNSNLNSVRFSEERVARAGLAIADVRRVAAGALQEHGIDWIERVWTSDEIEAIARAGAPAASGWGSAWARCFHPERTADLVVQAKPWHLLGMDAGTSHGTVYPYDRRVPLAFLGAGVARGKSFERASPADIVPTLLALLGVDAPADLDGRALALD